MVRVSGHTVRLKTKYRAIVDATNGDTILERIDATFLHTSLVARGGVYDVEGVHGRLVTLDIDMPSGRLEDIMHMAVKTSQPPMTGGLRLRTNFNLPPGDADVVDKLKLDGAFTIDDGRFTNAEVRQKINELSRRASAKESKAAPQAASHFSGRFELADGRLALSTLTFNVPGAIVELSGQYSLTREILAFNGSLYMDAKVSQTTTGRKSLMLKVVDPMFRKDVRTVIPIKIGGTRDEPSFGMDARRVFRR